MVEPGESDPGMLHFVRTLSCQFMTTPGEQKSLIFSPGRPLVFPPCTLAPAIAPAITRAHSWVSC